MKRTKFLGVSLIVLLTTAIALYLEACKKDAVTPINIIEGNNYESAYYTDYAKSVAAKVRRFKSQLVDKEQVVRSGLYMPIDSIIWNVEALFNVEYADPDRKYLETVKQNLEFFVDVNENGEAPFSVVADLYEEITDAVRQAYSGDGISSDKSLKTVVVDKGDLVGNRVIVNVFVVSGKVDNSSSFKDPVAGPFGPDDCWYFGEYGGACDDPSIMSDAAEILEDTINYYYSYTKVPQPGFRYVHHGMFRISLEGSEYFDDNGDPYLYFYPMNSNPPLYMNGDWLNYYYTRELEVLLHLLPNDPAILGMMPRNPVFMGVDIIGLLGYVGNGSYYQHKNYIIYGDKALVPVQELPPLRDLLD